MDLCQVAPAKVNLTLHVGDLRRDGYHSIESFVAFLSLADCLTCRIESGSPGTVLSSSGPFGRDMPNDPNANIVVRAVQLFFRENGWEDYRTPRLSIHVKKNIPVGAGLGGGSADAAAMLRMLAACFDTRVPLDELACKLGSDVPACILSHPCLLSGRGEKLRKISLERNGIPPCFVVLVYPGSSLLTGFVYKRFALEDRVRLPLNDLEHVARKLCPGVGEALRALSGTPGCLSARISGSGSACFGLYESQNLALEAKETIQRGRPAWWVHVCTFSTL